MNKKSLKERFQQLAGIKPLYEQPRNEPGVHSQGAEYPFGQNDTDVPQLPTAQKININVLGDKKDVNIVGGNKLKDVTISWNEPWGEERHTVTFELDENLGGAEAYDEADESVWIAVSEDSKWDFILDPVWLPADYEYSQTVNDWDWNTLVITKHNAM
jgi:hypothetical protein